MKFSRTQKFWSAAENNGSRPILGHVMIERVKDEAGIAIASNGFLLAVIPVELEDGDVPGLVRANLFPMAARIKEHKGSGRRSRVLGQARMTLGEDRVTLADESTHLRIGKGVEKDSPYPNWRRLVPSLPVAADVSLREVGIDCRFLSVVGEALGIGKDTKGLRMTFTGQSAPVMVEPEGRFANEAFEPPYGLVMPQTLTLRMVPSQAEEKVAS